jgi:hypothetical protein
MSGSGDGARTTRPRQVTLGAGLALAGCVLLLVSLVDAMQRVRSVEMRASLATALSRSPGSGLGIGVDQMVDILRGLVMVSAALAAAGAVLAGFAFARHRGARVALSVTAVLLLFTATFVSGLLPVVVAVAVTMLWSQEARDWFAGRSPRTAGPSAFATPRDGAGPQAGPPAPPRADAPTAPAAAPTTDPTTDPTTAPTPALSYPAASPHPDGPGQPYASPYAPRSSGRPRSVALAAGLTWAFAGLTTLFLLLVVLTLAASPTQLLTELERNPQIAAQGYSRRQLLAALWVVSALGLFWCLSAIVLAALAFRRVNAARIALVVSCGCTVVVGVFSVAGVLHAVAAGCCGVLLLLGTSRQWYEGRPGGPQGPPPSWGSPPGPDERRPDQGSPPVW